MKNKLKSFAPIRWASMYATQLIVLVIIIIAVSIISPVFMTQKNIINVLRQISSNLYIGCALTMILITGGIDLSTGSIIAVSGMVCTYMTLAGVPFVLSMLVSLACGAAIGSISGFIISRTTLPPFIVTYSMQSILRGMVYVITNAAVIRISDEAFLNFGSGFLWFIPLPVIYLIVMVAITVIILNSTKLGRHMYAVGGNPRAAQYAGISIRKTKMFIYIMSGVAAALAGLVLTSRNTSMQPNLGNGMEMDAIAAVVLGGTSMGGGMGSIGGTVLGALIIGFINNGLNLMGVDSFYQYIVKGVAILLAVYSDYIKSQRLINNTGKQKL